MHAAGEAVPGYVLLKLRAPEAERSRLRLVVSGDPYEAPGRSDFILRVGLAEGDGIRWLGEKVIDAGEPPSAENWQTVQYDLPECAGQAVGVVIEVAYGGKVAAMNEEAFFDEIGIVPADE